MLGREEEEKSKKKLTVLCVVYSSLKPLTDRETERWREYLAFYPPAASFVVETADTRLQL